jgi:alkanesulfonate monooxygenase SsuD/methylene tetrahydromethanopterin reductase-like flavin-dependent oxidoreductase (luciferase family)
LWAATGDTATARELGRRGIVNAIFLRGVEGTKRAWSAYREARAEAGLPAPLTDRFAYMGFTYVGDSDAEGAQIGSKSLWFLTVGGRSAPQFTRFLPGQTPAALGPQIYRSGPRPGQSGAPPVGRPAQALRNVTAEQALAQGIMFAGNPDTVFRRIKEFYDQVGGFDHLILMGRSGFMTRAESEKGIRLFAKEVLPRLCEIPTVPAG